MVAVRLLAIFPPSAFLCGLSHQFDDDSRCDLYVNFSQSQSNYAAVFLQCLVRHTSALKRNILLQLLLFKWITLFVEL